MRGKSILIMILLSMLISGCITSTSLQKDPFYTDNGVWDYPRLPLIKPYYMKYSGNDFGWVMPLQANPPSKSTYYYYNVHDVRKLAVENNVIMVYTPFVEPIGPANMKIGQKVLYWFAIVPDKNIEEGFDKEADFLNYIQAYDIREPSWVEPDAAYKQLGETGCMDWIPNCR